jgi:hypothetical protein
LKKSEAIADIRMMFWSVQKIRSDITEEWGDDAAAMLLLPSLHPWLFGDQNIIPAFERVLQVIDQGGELAPLDFYNLVIVATRQAPEIIARAQIAGVKFPFVEADRNWLNGWEPETPETAKV